MPCFDEEIATTPFEMQQLEYHRPDATHYYREEMAASTEAQKYVKRHGIAWKGQTW